MAKPELGTKRLCAGCGAKFYDLNKDPITCPKCSTVFQALSTTTRVRPEAVRAPIAAAAPAPEAEVPEPAEAEFVSLEEADAETEGTKKQPVAEGEEEEVGDEALDDAAFLEPDEDEGDDVTGIIGGDIENEEET